MASVRRAAALAASVAVLGGMMSGCAAEGSSTFTISYEQGGETRTVTAHPTSIECTDEDATGMGVDASPRYSVSLFFGGSLREFGRVWTEDGDLVYFTGSDLDIDADGDRVVVHESAGEVQIVESTGDSDWEDVSVGDDVPAAPATLSADLVCDG